MSKKLTLYMETTKKEPEETIAEIQVFLKRLNIRDMLINYDEERNVEGVSFTIQKDGQLIPFKLPANHRPLWNLACDGKTRYIRNEEQARRVAWRQVYQWIRAQLAMIEIEMVSTDEIFLPYLLISDKKTLYQRFLEVGSQKLLSGGK